MTDVIAEIDALMAEEICPKCGHLWHELPLTRALLKMFESGEINGYYFGRVDDSPIICEGATFIGPQRPDPPPEPSEYDDGIILHSTSCLDSYFHKLAEEAYKIKLEQHFLLGHKDLLDKSAIYEAAAKSCAKMEISSELVAQWFEDNLSKPIDIPEISAKPEPMTLPTQKPSFWQGIHWSILSSPNPLLPIP